MNETDSNGKKTEQQELSPSELDKVAGGFTASEHGAKGKGAVEIKDYSFDIEQVLNIGSR